MYWSRGVKGVSTMNGCSGEHGCGNPTGASSPHCIMSARVWSLNPAMRVLYLGAANGTTVSHVADYAEVVYAVEFSPRPMQDLIEVARRRKNIIPIMADATRPDLYTPLVEAVDLVYQDVAQPDQAVIAIRNCVFLKPGGSLILMLKTRSVDVRKDPGEVFDETITALKEAGFTVQESVWLVPYHQDHAAIVCTKPVM